MVGRPKWLDVEEADHPTEATARSIAKRHDLEMCVVLFVTAEVRRLGYASYGKDRETCEATRHLADQLYELAEEILSGRPQLLEGSLDDLHEALAHLETTTDET